MQIYLCDNFVTIVDSLFIYIHDEGFCQHIVLPYGRIAVGGYECGGGSQSGFRVHAGVGR